MRFLAVILLFCTSALVGADVRGIGSRIKDIASVAGSRENQLVGMGLVVGLNGDGDKNQSYTLQMAANALQRFGVNIPASAISAKNIAVVMVTADIKPFTKPGARIDVTVSAFGDAQSLQGGTLLQTPLYGAKDSKDAYAVAQGMLAVGGFINGTGGTTVQKNHPTVAKISNGALVEREPPSQMVREHHMDFLLREPDFTTAARMADAINAVYPESALALDISTVRVAIPEGLDEAPVQMLSKLENIEVSPDVAARVIINERTGTIVATSHIKISSCAVSHGDLTITVSTTQDVSQPNALSQNGNTTVTDRSNLRVKESKGRLIALDDMPTIEKVAAGLNAIGVTPRDMMSIFQAMKEAGSLQAELVLR